MKEKIEILAVVGPTASGKTALSIELAKKLNGEIISCDSMQIYKGMNIGTAKPTIEEMCGIPHHLIDIIEPNENFSCADYTVLAKEKIEDIHSRGKLPIFCGGTGLYLDSVLAQNKFSPEPNRSTRDELSKRDIQSLYDELCRIDPKSAEKIHINNTKRVIRALEIYYDTGITKSEWDERSRDEESPYDALIAGLDYKDREKLYERINLRVDLMIQGGLIDEVLSLDLKENTTAAQAIGYKEIIAYQKGECTLSEAIEKIKQGTRRYAKRQLTWFHRNEDIRWFYMDNDDRTNIVKNILNLLTK